jgi:pimeloyl-ACP methyl ester carboxylesterase
MVSSSDIRLRDRRALRVYDSADNRGQPSTEGTTLLWHHGSPQTGALLAPVLAATTARGIRLVSFGRAGYGGSTARVGRKVADCAPDVEQLLETLGIAQCAVMGASGGGPHALACAAALPDRVTTAVTVAGIAPFRVDVADGVHVDPRTGADDEDWFAGMADDCAFVRPWGVNLGTIRQPVLVIQGGRDRVVPPSHAQRLTRAIPNAELWLRPQDGHVSVLGACAEAMDWISAPERIR